MDGQRKFSRRGIKVPVRWAREGSERFLAGDYARDISKGGMCLLVREQLEQGARIIVEFSLPGPRFILTSVCVIRCEQSTPEEGAVQPLYEVGVEFISIQDEEGEEIEKFVFASFFT